MAELLRLRSFSIQTPRRLYALHRFLFRITNGVWNDTLSFILRLLNGKYQSIDSSISIFKYTNNDIKPIVDRIESDGYCILPQKLSDQMVDDLVKMSLNTPVRWIMPVGDYAKEGSKLSTESALVESVKGKFARCVHDTPQVVQNSLVHNIALDPLFLDIAQEYLMVKPVLSSVVMWWSFPTDDIKKFSAAAAQEFHFDMDRLKFLNFFIYLTDVDASNGPHVFVKGTHKRLPRRFLKRGRFNDDSVRDHYGNDIIELKGKRGTIIAVDTRGLHKGKILERDARLLFQVGFANSLFGESYIPAVIKEFKDQRLKQHAERHRYSYFNYLP